MIQLFLVRHGLTEWNLTNRFQGWSDVPMNSEGYNQVGKLAKQLSGIQFAAVYSSDLCRAAQTAELIIAQSEHQHTPLVVQKCFDLREISFGDWEGLTFQDISQSDPEAVNHWVNGLDTFNPPGGESLAQLAERMKKFTKELLGNFSPDMVTQPILLVAHGGSLQLLLCLFLGVSIERYWQFHIEPASLSELQIYPEGAILNRLNV